MSQASAATHISRRSVSSFASNLSLASLQSYYADTLLQVEANIAHIIEVGDLGQRDHYWTYKLLMSLEYLGCVAGVDPAGLSGGNIANNRRSVRSQEVVRSLRRQERIQRLQMELARPEKAKLADVHAHISRSLATGPSIELQSWPL